MSGSLLNARVDVGIPTHGSAPFLAKSIESVLGQTFATWTLTISESGPESDKIKSIVEPYLADPRVHYVATGRDLGGAGNSTSLLQAGNAPYLGILHDDDLWASGFLERRVDFLEANPDCGLVFSACDFIDDSGTVLFRFRVDLEAGVQDTHRFLRQLYRGNLICIPTPLVRRQSYEAVGPAFDASLLFWDYEMWLRIAARLPVGFLDGVDASYRVHASQTTQDNRLHIGDHRLALLAVAERLVPADFPKIERRRASSKALARAALDALDEGDSGKAAGRAWAAVRAHPGAPFDPEMLSTVIRRRKNRKQRWALQRAGLVV